MKTKAIYCVYVARNILNRKPYVGQTNDFDGRKRDHRYAKKDTHFHNAIRKYGWQMFDWGILKDGLTKPLADFWEKHYIKEFNCVDNGYNMTEGGEGSIGLVHTEKTRKKMSRTRKGVPKTDEHKQNISKALMGENHPSWGKSPSDETRDKMSKSQTGRKGGMLGKSHSKATKQRLSDVNKGKTLTDEHRKKISDAHRKRWSNKNQLNLFA